MKNILKRCWQLSIVSTFFLFSQSYAISFTTGDTSPDQYQVQNIIFSKTQTSYSTPTKQGLERAIGISLNDEQISSIKDITKKITGNEKNLGICYLFKNSFKKVLEEKGNLNSIFEVKSIQEIFQKAKEKRKVLPLFQQSPIYTYIEADKVFSDDKYMYIKALSKIEGTPEKEQLEIQTAYQSKVAEENTKRFQNLVSASEERDTTQGYESMFGKLFKIETDIEKMTFIDKILINWSDFIYQGFFLLITVAIGLFIFIGKSDETYFTPDEFFKNLKKEMKDGMGNSSSVGTKGIFIIIAIIGILVVTGTLTNVLNIIMEYIKGNI